jgi:hypothetical protein
MTTQPDTASAAGEPAPITDEQVIQWAAAAITPEPIKVSTLLHLHRLFDRAKHALGDHCPGGSGHLLESVEMWPNVGTDATFAGTLLTVDLPAGTTVPEPGGIRLCTLQLDLEDLVNPEHTYASAEELYTDLLTGVLSYARDEIDKHRRALRYDDLAVALAEARAALAGAPGDAEHDALHGLAGLVASILEGGQL